MANELEETIEVLDKEDTGDRYIIKLITPVTFEDKTYTVLDLHGLENLTGRDLSNASRYLGRSGDVSVMKEFEPDFCFAIAAKAMDVPIEFFYAIKLRDAIQVKNVVTGFFYRKD